MSDSPREPWNILSPFDTGLLRSAGVGLYATLSQLDLPAEHDIPMEFVFHNTTASGYGLQLFMNGCHFGKLGEFSQPKSACSYKTLANKVAVP